MSNHFHLLVKLPDPRQVSTLMAGLLRDELASEAQDRQERWRSFLLGEDPREQAVRRGDWVIGDDAFPLQVSQARGRPGKSIGVGNQSVSVLFSTRNMN
jgi:hypothetical protein